MDPAKHSQEVLAALAELQQGSQPKSLSRPDMAIHNPAYVRRGYRFAICGGHNLKVALKMAAEVGPPRERSKTVSPER